MSCEVKPSLCGISTSRRSAIHDLQLSPLRRGLSCHPPYRSVYWNVKYHWPLEDIIWQSCQRSLEYFFLIAPAAASTKWPLVSLVQPLRSWWEKITWFNRRKDKWNGPSFTIAALLCSLKRLVYEGVGDAIYEGQKNILKHALQLVPIPHDILSPLPRMPHDQDVYQWKKGCLCFKSWVGLIYRYNFYQND